MGSLRDPLKGSFKDPVQGLQGVQDPVWGVSVFRGYPKGPRYCYGGYFPKSYYQ